MPELHAKLGPSNHRWPHCPGSIREEAQYQDVAGAAAIDGTGSHLLLELCLQSGCRAEQYDGQVIGVNHHDQPMGWMVEPSRIERVQMCLNYVARRVKELKEQYPDCEVEVTAETRADPGGAFGRSDWWGTCDITIEVRKWTEPGAGCLFVEVCDYKDGRGWVSEKENSQLISYAFGKCRQYIASGPDLVRPFKPGGVRDGVRMSIVQPKTSPVIRYQDMPTADLIERAERLSKAAYRTDASDAPLIAGKHCQWCKANPKRGGHCTAESAESMEVMKTMSNDIIVKEGQSLFEVIEKVIGDVKSLDEEQLAALADARSGIEAAFDKVEKEITARLDTGVTVPGYAMKPGRSSRVWNADAETIEKKLRSRKLKKEDIYPPQLISVAQLMKSDKLTPEQKEKLERELVTTKSGAMKLTKVGRGNEGNFQQKTVGQDDSNVEQLFAGVVKNPTPSVFAENDAEAETPKPEVSFF